MELKKKLGKRIQELRVKNGLTQAELSEKACIAAKHQSCIETGKNYPSAELIEKYAKIFNVDVSEVLLIGHIKDNKTLKSEIDRMLEKNQDKIQYVYRVIKALVD